MAFTTPATLRRFRACKSAILEDAFKKICEAVGVDWEEVVDAEWTSPSSSMQWELRIEADADLKNAIFELIKDYSGDANLIIRKIEKGSLIFVLEGSLEGFERMEYLFREGLVQELAGAQILGVRTRATSNAVQLQNWLQGYFDAIWQPPNFAFARTLSATDTTAEQALSPISRAKVIQLGTQADVLTVQLVIKLTPQANGGVNIAVQIYPVQEVTYLPAGLQLTVIEPTSELYEFVEVQDQANWAQLEIAFEPGETFQVQLQLGEVVVTEDFIV
ncbi:MAG: DUF1822 family protein [Cyanobacteria bacterium J06639_14]